MEVILGFIAIAYLVSPAILIGVAIVHRRQLREMRNEINRLSQRLDREPPVEPEPALGDDREVAREPEPPQLVAVEQEPPPQIPEPPPEAVRKPAAADAPVPKRVAAPQRLEPSGPSLSQKFGAFLDSVGMMPPKPSEGMTKETVLMQWWLPRVGGVLALLSALFFGVYINQSTSALFKFLELLVLSLAICGGGWLLEKKYAAFGNVLLVTGMVMVYLTSVAGYILPATRIISNPLLGSLVQAGVLVWICGVGYRRRSLGMILMAFHFGYFLSLFMAWESLREGALIAAALLFSGGALLSLKPLFKHLVWVIIPGSFLVPLSYPFVFEFHPLLLPGAISVIVFINAIFAGVATLYYKNFLEDPARRRLLLALTTTLAMVTTGLFFRVHYPDSLEWASLVLAVNFLGFAMLGWTTRSCGFFAQLLFIKGSLLLAFWAVLYFAGDLRWMALALETIALAYAARRARVIAMEFLVWFVAIVSLVFFQIGFAPVPISLSFHWWTMMAYPAVIICAMAYLLPAFADQRLSVGETHRDWAYLCIPLAAVAIWYLIIHNTPQRSFDQDFPFIVVVYAGAGLTFLPQLSRRMLLMVCGLAFLTANLLFWSAPFSPLSLLLLTVGSAVAAIRLSSKTDSWAAPAENAIYPLILVSMSLYILQLLSDWSGQAAVAFGCGIAILLLGIAPRLRHVSSWAFIPIVVFLVTEQPVTGAGWFSLLNLGSGLLWLALPGMFGLLRTTLGWGSKHDLWSCIAAFLYWIYVVFYGDPQASWMSGQLVMGILALVLLVATLKFRISGFFAGALLLIGTHFLRHSLYMLDPGVVYLPWKSEALVSCLFVYAFALVWFFNNPPRMRLPQELNTFPLAQVGSFIIALMLFGCSAVTFSYKELNWLDWYTPVLALSAFGMIILGLVWNDKVVRQLGILALLVPLIRLFVVDVQDVLHRIIAFAAAAVLLTVLGYLYHRLSERLKEN